MVAFRKIESTWCFVSLALILLGAQRGAADGLEPEIPGIEVLRQRMGGSIAFSLRNPHLAELTVSLDFSGVNLASNVKLPVEVVVPASCTTQPLVAIRPVDLGKPWNYTWHSNFTWGSPRVHHSDDQLYLLPFPPGRSFRVVQGQDGGFSHTGENRFAIDFGTPEGTPVLAARDGLIVLTRDGFDAGAPDPAFKKRANLVFVRHSDGTLGEYLHLLKGTVRARVGQTVRAGQLLAYSGNSGYSRGPHLHFMVFRAKDSKTRESLPIRFVTAQGSGLVLEEGGIYASPPPSGTAKPVMMR
jgi:murein DD-endopeptidase MepM/ murein hydrolase activator NlpD